MDLPAAQAVLAENIRRLADARSLSLYVVADFAGISRAHLYAILRGEKNPTVATLVKLADVLGVEPWELLKPK